MHYVPHAARKLLAPCNAHAAVHATSTGEHKEALLSACTHAHELAHTHLHAHTPQLPSAVGLVPGV